MDTCLIHRQFIACRAYLVVRCHVGFRSNGGLAHSDNGNLTFFIHSCDGIVAALVIHRAVALIGERIVSRIRSIGGRHSGLFKAQLRIRHLNGKFLNNICKSIIPLCLNGYGTGIRTGVYVITVNNGVVRTLRQRSAIDGYGNIRRNPFAGISINCVTAQFHSRFGNNGSNRKRPVFIRQVTCCVKIRAVRHTNFNLVFTRIHGLHFRLALIVFHHNIAHAGDVRRSLDVCNLCRAVICQAARYGKDKILRCGSCLLNLISHTGCHTAHCDACGISTDIGGIRTVRECSTLSVSKRVADCGILLTGEQFVLKYCLFVAAIVDQSILLRCLDGHAAAVSIGTVRCINAGGGNRLAVCAQRVLPTVLVGAKVQITLLILCNQIAAILRVRLENLGIVYRTGCSGSNLNRSLWPGAIVSSHTNTCSIRQTWINVDN